MLQIDEWVRSAAAPEQVFAFVADFRNLPDWDPSARAAELLTAEPMGPGARFRVDVAFRGRVVPMEYELKEYDPPHRAVLAGAAPRVEAIDVIEVHALESGSEVRYLAQFRFHSWLRLLEPLFRGEVRRLGDAARAGLATALAERYGG